MGLIIGLIKRLIRLFVYFIVFAAIIVLIPNLPPYTSFTRIDLEPTLAREGPLAENNEFNKLEKLYTDKLLGPECFQLYKGEVYTSLATGEIVKLTPGGHVTFVTQLGQPCAGIKEEAKCGRPLGFVINEKGVMYVADAYHGIWSVDIETNKKTLLVSPQVAIEGQAPKLFNSVALDSKGNLYYTDSTADFSLQDGALSMFADPNGRLFQYNAAKNESKVLLDKLWFANGLVVSPDDESIIFAETAAHRLMKYYLNGPKKGKKEVFVAGFPGTPDNVRALPGGGLQVALYAAFARHEPLLTRSLAAAPLARKLLVRLQCALQAALQFLHGHFPHVLFEDAIYAIGHFKSLGFLLPSSSGVVHIDWNGNIINSFFHTEGKLFISDAILFKDKVYLGQPHGQNFVAAVPAPPSFKRAFTPLEHKSQVKREVPNTQAPKPAEKSKSVPTPVKVVSTPKPEAPTTTPPPPKPKQQPPKPTQEPPKPAQQPPKPAQQAPKPAQQPPKPAQQAPKAAPAPPTTTKPVQESKQKPAEQKKAEAKDAPKQAQPSTKPVQEPPKPTQQPPKPAQQPPKPAQQPPKPAQQPAKATGSPPPAKPVQATKQKPAEQKKVDPPKGKVPEHIPIKEEIPSDTIKPSKETLKVIKKAGPAEIPNPEL